MSRNRNRNNRKDTTVTDQAQDNSPKDDVDAQPATNNAGENATPPGADAVEGSAEAQNAGNAADGAELTPPPDKVADETPAVDQAAAQAALAAQPPVVEPPAPAVAPKPVMQQVQAGKSKPGNVQIQNGNNQQQGPKVVNTDSSTKPPVIAPKPVEEVVLDEDGEMARILKDVPSVETSNIKQLRQYIKDMAPSRVQDPDTGARRQVLLARVLRQIVSETRNFDPIFRAALKLFELHRNGVFHPANAFRFMESSQFSLSKAEVQQFTALVNMFSICGPVKGRELAVKTVDFEKTLRYNFTEDARSRVKAFFKV